MTLGDDGYVSRYTYNHAGERVIKSHGQTTVAFVNGAPQGILWHDKDNWTMYVSPYMVVTNDRFTKHYYAGSQRIASKIGVGEFKNLYVSGKASVTAGQKDYGERMNLITQSRAKYYAALGIPPGPPTAKGIYGEAEYSGMYGSYTIEQLGNYDVPNGWPMKPYKRPYGGTPGPPVMYTKPVDPDTECAGMVTPMPRALRRMCSTIIQTDHLGSTSYITDGDGKVTQFVSYKPYSELLVDEHTVSYDAPYKFNGKELDSETGLYYYGARYYEPVVAIFYGTDRYAEKFPWQSAYSYAGGNPIKFIDVNGDSIMTKVNGNDYKYDLENRCFIDKNECKYEGDDTYIIALTQALQTLSESETGNCLLTELYESSSNVVICESRRNSESEVKDDKRYKSRVLWNSKKDAAFGGSAFVSLGHELAHTLDRFWETIDMGTWFVTPESKSIPNAEKFSTFIENKIRYENNLSLRRSYAVDNNNRPCAGWILDSKNRAVYFNKQGDMSNRRIKRNNRYVFK